LHACHALKESGFEVIAFSRSQPKIKSVYHIFIKGEILDAGRLIKASVGCDAVLHLTCKPLTSLTEEDYSPSFQINTIGTMNVLEAALHNNCKRFVFTSSSQVIGVPGVFPQDEDIPCRPRSAYGASKLCAEILCNYFQRNYGLKCITLRLFNVYGSAFNGGPRNSIDEIFIRKLHANQAPIVTSHPDEGRDFVHISDVQCAILKSLDFNREIPSGLYNIGTGRLTTFPELAKLIAQLMGKNTLPKIDSEGAKKPMRLQADFNKAKSGLGFTPGVSLEKGLELLIANYTQNGASRK